MPTHNNTHTTTNAIGTQTTPIQQQMPTHKQHPTTGVDTQTTTENWQQTILDCATGDTRQCQKTTTETLPLAY